MRKQHFLWTYLVLATVLTIYGGYTLIYHFNHNNKLSVLSLVFLIIGTIMLIVFLVLYLISLKNKKKEAKAIINDKEPEIEPAIENKPDTIDKSNSPKPSPGNNGVTYTRGSAVTYGGDNDVYVKKVGYGPILRVTGNRILDMRNNTYYRIENNAVNQEGSGLIFEINGNKIRTAFSGYLYEISGNNINKVYGGFYASISGNYITLFDSSEKYELTGSLNQKQLLVFAALIFGTY